MLVLSARVGESIHIGNNIVVTVLKEPSSGKLQLGFTAPKDVVILRDKVKDRQEQPNERG